MKANGKKKRPHWKEPLPGLTPKEEELADLTEEVGYPRIRFGSPAEVLSSREELANHPEAPWGARVALLKEIGKERYGMFDPKRSTKKVPEFLREFAQFMERKELEDTLGYLE